MSVNIDMDRLNEHDRRGAMETINLVYEDLSKWDDALRVNQMRAEDACHFKQAERLQDARSHYQGVVDRILTPLLNRINTMTDDGYASWWTPQQTADYLGRSVATLAKWRSLLLHPDLKWKKHGHNVLYFPDSVRSWFENQLKDRSGTLLEDCTRNQKPVRSRS